MTDQQTRRAPGRRFARPREDVPEHVTNDSAAPGAAEPKLPHPNSKRANVVAMLEREQGATIADITEATGWLAHTARAMLTGLRNQGHAIVGIKTEGGMVYRLGSVA